jgi:hypothetical protein
MYHEPPCPIPVCPSPVEPFYIEAVVVSDGYSDFLRHTLPHTKFLFDKIVVVTSHEDKKTQRICEWNHVEVVTTDLLETRKGKFCKGKGINVGLDALTKKNWVAHLDGDILLPPQTRIILEKADLDKNFIYGFDRFNVRGVKALDEFLDAPRLQQECNTYIHLNGFPLGTRVMHDFAGGYVPLGFGQIWSPSVSGVYEYPDEHTDAGRGDTVFSQIWPRSKRGFIPEIVAYHLESTDAKNAANWNGRTTAPFSHSVESE